MSTKVSALKRAVNTFKKSMRPQQFGLRGKAFVCPLCDHDHFTIGNAALLIGLYTLECTECGRVELFGKMPPAL